MVAVVLNPIFSPTFERSATKPARPASHPIYGDRPTLRGRFHQLGSLVSVPLGCYLVLKVARPDARTGVAIYALTASLMFITSASYHRLAQSIVARFWMRRLDHSMIFVHIAGATTPIALLGVGGRSGQILLVTSWTGAGLGSLLKMTSLTAENDPCPWFFPLLGFLPLLAIPHLVANYGLPSALLLAGSGIMYTIGAACFARKSPDPAPQIFGYHEIWHVFTLAAGAFQFLVTVQLAS